VAVAAAAAVSRQRLSAQLAAHLRGDA
jgi:hypothetical protein